jgi:hypothetical protein
VVVLCGQTPVVPAVDGRNPTDRVIVSGTTAILPADPVDSAAKAVRPSNAAGIPKLDLRYCMECAAEKEHWLNRERAVVAHIVRPTVRPIRRRAIGVVERMQHVCRRQHGSRREMYFSCR